MIRNKQTPDATNWRDHSVGLTPINVKTLTSSYTTPRFIVNPRTGCRVGVARVVDGVTVFERRVIESKHRLRLNCGSWALEVALIEQLEGLGVEWVVIVTDRGRKLCAPLAEFRKKGWRVEFGYGPQLALRESRFTPNVGPIPQTLVLPGLEDD